LTKLGFVRNLRPKLIHQIDPIDMDAKAVVLLALMGIAMSGKPLIKPT
jgi:hypothetical protein